jgi:hypothetical protein
MESSGRLSSRGNCSFERKGLAVVSGVCCVGGGEEDGGGGAISPRKFPALLFSRHTSSCPVYDLDKQNSAV